MGDTPAGKEGRGHASPQRMTRTHFAHEATTHVLRLEPIGTPINQLSLRTIHDFIIRTTARQFELVMPLVPTILFPMMRRQMPLYAILVGPQVTELIWMPFFWSS